MFKYFEKRWQAKDKNWELLLKKNNNSNYLNKNFKGNIIKLILWKRETLNTFKLKKFLL